MAALINTVADTTIRAKLVYTRENGRRQRAYHGTVPTTAEEKQDAEVGTAEVIVEVPMHDARCEKGGVHFATHGFELVRAPTALSLQQFEGNSDYIKQHYYLEVEAAIQKCTGAALVKSFHHMTRNSNIQRDKRREAPRPPARANKGEIEREGTAPIVHCDYSVRGSLRLFDSMAPKNMRRGRYVVINAWRNIAYTPICDHHLAMCDARSVVAPDDFVIFDVVKPDRVDQTYRLDPGHHAFHYWMYYPFMERDELLLFKQYDSDSSSRSRYTFHTAFRDPTAPKDSPPRQSIEVRCIAFFPDHEPNTIPSIILKDDEKVNKAVNGIMSAVVYGEQWPADARKWIGSLVGSSEGVELVLKELVKGGTQRGEHGLDSLTEKQRADVLAQLLQPSMMTEFQKRCHEHFEVLSKDQARAQNLVMQVSSPQHWPAPAKMWMRMKLYRGAQNGSRSNPAALQDVLRTMIRESIKRGDPVWRNTTPTDHDAVIALLLSSGEFEQAAKRNFPPQGGVLETCAPS